jgi:hypothetical protein
VDLYAGLYSSEVGPVYIEPKHESGNYDREVFLVLKEFEPTFGRGGDMAMDFLSPATKVKALEEQGESGMKASLAKGMPHGYEVGYGSFTSMAGSCTTGNPSASSRASEFCFTYWTEAPPKFVVLPCQVIPSMSLRWTEILCPTRSRSRCSGLVPRSGSLPSSK